MTTKRINTRVIQKHDFEVHWDQAKNFYPEKGEIIIYDCEVDAQGNVIAQLPEGRTMPYIQARFKIGDGVTVVSQLPFAGIDLIAEALEIATTQDIAILAEAQAYTNEAIESIKESGEIEESDPTVPAWAKEPTKPAYSTDELVEGIETWIFYAGNANDVIDPLAPALIKNEAGGYTAEIG